MRGSRGHIYYDLALLVLLFFVASAIAQSGVQRHSLIVALIGAWGMILAAALPTALVVNAFTDSGERGWEFAAGPFVLCALAGGLAGAVWGLRNRSLGLALAGFAGGCVAGVPASIAVTRRPALRDPLDRAAAASAIGTLVAYALGLALLLAYSVLIVPFRELGFSDGLKISLVFALLLAGALAFVWALGRFPAFSKAVMGVVVFGLAFGFAAFLTLLFWSERAGAGALYGVLGGEAALAAAFSAWAMLRQPKRS